VLFCPSHLGIIKDAPSVRRKFLDIAISQLKPVYIKLLNKYNNILENRNSVLKMDEQTRKEFGDMINIYSDELASLCADITEIRMEYVKKLDFWVEKFFDEMTYGKERTKITYESVLKEKDLISRENIKNEYYRLLTANVDKEIKNGSTLYGIHKDDLKIELNKKDAKLYSSQGQGRSLALAMKMAEGEISREQSGEYPVFLLDDVLSELDKQRRDFILNNIKDRQVIITSCEPEMFNKDFDADFIKIENGKQILKENTDTLAE
jgi:DNA replication and repair protein RecF